MRSRFRFDSIVVEVLVRNTCVMIVSDVIDKVVTEKNNRKHRAQRQYEAGASNHKQKGAYRMG